MIFELEGFVANKVKVMEGVYYLSIESPSISSVAYPGQFVLIRVSPSLDPLLRRPFSIAGVKDGCVEVLFSVVGRGTELLSRVKIGDVLSLRGPLGKGFPAPSFELLLVGGGMGVAPLLFAHQRYGGKIVFGVKDKVYKGLCDWIRDNVGDGLSLFSEDGSIGERGTALDGALSLARSDAEVWVCGPDAMLYEAFRVLSGKVKRLLGSFESRMACGIGGCYGCSIRTKGGMKRVCYDGPVFDLREVF